MSFFFGTNFVWIENARICKNKTKRNSFLKFWQQKINEIFAYIQKYDASWKKICFTDRVFLGNIDIFSKELHFFEGDAKFSIFTKIWKQNVLTGKAGLKPRTSNLFKFFF